MVASAYGTILTSPVVYGNSWGSLGGVRLSSGIGGYVVQPSVYTTSLVNRPLISSYSVPIQSSVPLVGLNYGSLGLKRNTILDYI